MVGRYVPHSAATVIQATNRTLEASGMEGEFGIFFVFLITIFISWTKKKEPAGMEDYQNFLCLVMHPLSTDFG